MGGGLFLLAFALVPVPRGPSGKRTGREMSGPRAGARDADPNRLRQHLDAGIHEARGTADFWRCGHGKILSIKLAPVAMTWSVSGPHDVLVGPRAIEAMRRDPTAPAALKLRTLASTMGRANLLLAVAIILCIVMLVRGAL